jgi:S-adenosylmethionine:tRNA ribosyltransferase-isomerase
MFLSDFDYKLPKSQIAQRPLDRRADSRLLLLERATGECSDSLIRDLPKLLRGDDLLVVNNARVIPARLFGKRLGTKVQSGNPLQRPQPGHLSSPIEVLLTSHILGNEWEALVRPGRKLGIGVKIVFGGGELVAEIIARGEYGQRHLKFSSLGKSGEINSVLNRLGHMPLPPYIDREGDLSDRERYQTIFASRPGAVAAPTAGLHFTPELVEQIQKRGAQIAEITLDVGLGTFRPIHCEQVEDHQIHSETYEIPEDTAEAIRKAKREGRSIVAVGTTVVRALEDAARKSELEASISSARKTRVIPAGRAEADIYIYPGHKFRVVDALLTNFHLPRSTLLVLVSAFAGRERVLAAYGHAVSAGYRFYSYGDCMFIR